MLELAVLTTSRPCNSIIGSVSSLITVLASLPLSDLERVKILVVLESAVEAECIDATVGQETVAACAIT